MVLLFTFTTAQKMKFSIKDFFSKCEKKTADLVTFNGAILNGKLHFFVQCAVPEMESERKISLRFWITFAT